MSVTSPRKSSRGHITGVRTDHDNEIQHRRELADKVNQLVAITNRQDVVSVKGYLAKGDGVTNDTAAILSAIASNRTVFLPAGTYLVSASAGSDAILMDTLSNCHLLGAGENTTIIKLANSADAHVFNITSCTNCSLSNMTIDGNRANQAAGVHGIRADGTRLRFSNLYVLNAKHYGMGLGQANSLKDVKLENITVEGSGDDGIDMKNKNDDNYGVSLNNIMIDSHNRDGGASNAGIDIRGEGVRLSNIHVRGLDATAGAGAIGIRFREGELLAANGLGGHKSSLTGFSVIGDATTNTDGLSINTRNVQISNGLIEDCGTGVKLLDSDITLNNVHAVGCSAAGFDHRAGGGGLDANDCALTACVADTCVIGFDYEAVSNCHLIGSTGRGNTTADVRIQASAADTTLIGNKFYSTTTVSDGGTTTHARNNFGWVTEAYLRGSTDHDLTTTGAKTENVTHGLAVTPSIEHCQIGIDYKSGNKDAVLGQMPFVDSVSSTVIAGRMLVSTADTAVTSVANFTVYVNARP